jgi:spore germination protein KC
MMANNFLSRRLELSHAEVAVFSEDLAKGGTIIEYLRGMIRSREFRPTINVVVCKGKAEEYLRSIKPTLDLDPAKYYELTFSAYRYTGLSIRSQLEEFYADLESPGVQPVAVLAGVNKSKPPKGGQSGGTAQGGQSGGSGGDQSGGSGDSAQGDQSGGSGKESQAGGTQQQAKPEESTNKSKGRPQPLEGDYEAGSIPRTGDVKGEIEGLAVFDGGRLVGEMDGEAATDYLLVNGQFHNAYKTFADPQVQGAYVVLDVSQKSKPVRRVKIVGGKPQISVQIAVDADIQTIQSGYNYEDIKKLPILEQAVEAQLKDEIASFLSLTASTFHSDICGFGNNATGRFLTWKDWEDYHWLQQYKDATFDVNVRVKIRRPGMILQSGPIQSSRGASMQ